MFTPISVAVCDKGRAYIRNDTPRPFTGTLNVSTVDLATGEERVLVTVPVQLPSGAGALQWADVQAAAGACPPAGLDEGISSLSRSFSFI